MLVTLGYEGRDLDEVVGLLREQDVEVLVDVRATPRSRKPGLSKTRLSEALEAAGIAYRHEARCHRRFVVEAVRVIASDVEHVALP